MKKILSFVMVAVLAVMLTGCEKYDDSDLRNKVESYESRIAALESLSSYKDLLQKLSSGTTVTSCNQSGNEITLTFSDNSTVKFNVQGPKGDTGAPLTWNDLTEAQKEALKGAQGENGKTPEFKIENEKWYVRYSTSEAWKEIGSAIDRSLIKDLNNDTSSSTLYITLADGTVIPVFYGTTPEKEPYTFTVAKDVVFGFENLEAFREREILVPYTLTGDISSADDVQFSVSVRNHAGKFIPDYQENAYIEPIDAKSGNIRVINKGYMVPAYASFGSYRTFEDGEWYMEYPSMSIDIVAYFPDGSSRLQRIEALAMSIYVSPANNDYISWSDEYRAPYQVLPNTAGDYSFNINITLREYINYNLDAPAQLAFNQIFIANQSAPIFDRNNQPTATGPSTSHNGEDLIIKYVVTFHHLAHTGSGTRTANVNIGKWERANTYTSLMSLLFVQEK